MLIQMSEQARVRWHNALIELTLLTGVGYNLLLALINANVFTVRPVITYAVEFLVYAACFLLGLGSMSRQRIAMIFGGLGLIVTLMFVRFLVNWQIDPSSSAMPWWSLHLSCWGLLTPARCPSCSYA